MRRNTLIAIVSLGTLLLLALGFAVLSLVLDRRTAVSHEAADAITASDRVAEARESDPWARKESDAVAIVRRAVVSESPRATVRQRIDEGWLGNHLELFRNYDGEEPQWVASRVDSTSIYTVAWRHRIGAVEFGPRWYVQVDPEGPRPEGSGGVVDVNALASFLRADNPAQLARYYNRSAEVVRALTSHQFDGGLRLGSALLRYFFSGGATSTRAAGVHGWVVVPEKIVPDEELIYLAHFAWQERESEREAHWEVNLQTSGFQSRNLQAYQLMGMVSGISIDMIEPLRMPRLGGEEMDLSMDPRREREEDLRALRHLLHDERLREAVASLLSQRRTAHEVEDRGWRLRATDDRGVWEVRYDYLQDGEEESILWLVNANSGQAEPQSEIASVAMLALASRPAANAR